MTIIQKLSKKSAAVHGRLGDDRFHAWPCPSTGSSCRIFSLAGCQEDIAPGRRAGPDRLGQGRWKARSRLRDSRSAPGNGWRATWALRRAGGRPLPPRLVSAFASITPGLPCAPPEAGGWGVHPPCLKSVSDKIVGRTVVVSLASVGNRTAGRTEQGSACASFRLESRTSLRETRPQLRELL